MYLGERPGPERSAHPITLPLSGTGPPPAWRQIGVRQMHAEPTILVNQKDTQEKGLRGLA